MMRRTFLILMVVAVAACGARAADDPQAGELELVRARALEDSSFVYGIFAEGASCPVVEQRLAAAPLRPTVLLSVENGQGFLLDQPDGADLLTCALRNLQGSKRAAKALMLQDPSFLDRTEESARRVRLLAEYAAANKKLLAGVVIDVEPYTEERWSCATHQGKREIGSRFLALLRGLKAASGKLPVEAAIPWWYSLNDDIPELLPSTILGEADGVYFMVYGDEGGPVVNGGAEKVFDRMPPGRLQVSRGRTYVALATYESQSAAALEAEIAQVRQYYAKVRGFAGTAIFHATSQYNVPLVRILAGVVADTEGNGLASAQVECCGVKAQTNVCGKFTLRGLPEERATLNVSKEGYEPRSVKVELWAPGREREIPAILLAKKKQ